MQSPIEELIADSASRVNIYEGDDAAAWIAGGVIVMMLLLIVLFVYLFIQFP